MMAERRFTPSGQRAADRLLTRDEARRTVLSVTKLPELLRPTAGVPRAARGCCDPFGR
jgi:hypothetical protein